MDFLFNKLSKTIWDDVSKWVVEGYGGSFVFTKQLNGEVYKKKEKKCFRKCENAEMRVFMTKDCVHIVESTRIETFSPRIM